MAKTSVTRRGPGIVVGAWAVAATTLVVLGVVVVRHLSASGEPGMTTDSMGMRLGSALYRVGARSPSGPLLGRRLITAWQLDSVAVAVLVLLSAAYLTAAALVPLRSGGRGWPWSRTSLFLAGMAVCAFATNGSIAVYDQVLFSAHMAGHLALVMVAPALVVLGRPLELLLAASSPPRRARIQAILTGPVLSFLTSPPVAFAAYAVAIVGTHLTGLMNTIMEVTWAGQLEHLIYLVVGYQFFSQVIGGEPLRWRLTGPSRWLLLGIAMAVDTFTGIVLMQGTAGVAMVRSPRFAVDALGDTRTGGAIMWLGGDAIMAGVMIVLVVGWLYQPAQRQGDQQGWAEQARRASFEAHTGASAPDGRSGPDFDDEDGARTAYNRWLGSLSDRR